MSILLMKLRGVPEDELAELTDLLEHADIDYYETTAGSWGISLPAIWLRDEAQAEKAYALLNDYQQGRYQSAREDYERNGDMGQRRGWFDLIRENPLRFIVYMGVVLLLIYLSIIPWFRAGTGDA